MGLAVWLHAIGNDLLVSRWVFLDSQATFPLTFVNHVTTSIVVFLTVIFGAPLGLLLQLARRALHAGDAGPAAAAAAAVEKA
mmetsp:Transcript_7702/g.19448  ORF Transcript_7702/g.19448 Transcript_7702/m.19448 type:complete len:82 (-) Transcript_7702:158-403(-)